jgi:hypothetical protein
MAMIGYGQPQQSYVWSGKLNWKPGERHYIVWTWSGRKRSIYLDGKHRESGPLDPPLQGEGRAGGNSTKDVPVEGWMRGTLTGARLMVGLQYSPISVDEIRISSVARTDEEIARAYASDAPPARDAYTYVLDHCDGTPESTFVSGFSGEKGATLAGTYKVVEGRYGKALQLWSE